MTKSWDLSRSSPPQPRMLGRRGFRSVQRGPRPQLSDLLS